jgi:hypothetical protein
LWGSLTVDAGTLVAFLAPFLPYLAGKAGGKAVEEVGKVFTDEAWGLAKSLWTRLSGALAKDPHAATSTETLAVHPDDADSQKALESAVGAVLAADPALVRDLASVWTRHPRIARAVESGTWNVQQFGKFNTTISEAQHFHIGDTYEAPPRGD